LEFADDSEIDLPSGRRGMGTFGEEAEEIAVALKKIVEAPTVPMVPGRLAFSFGFLIVSLK
jgi:hypothetical protein